MGNDVDEVMKIIEDNKILGVDETFEKVSEIARNIPNIEAKTNQN